jgi:CubicO group peptidase (beta-lactamase class C family)
MRTSINVLARTLAALALSAGVASPLAAQAGPVPREAQVDAIFAMWDRPDSPGCALGVYRDGGIIYARGYGMADLERRVPITAHSVFDIGSTSKQFAAASMVLLAQQGRLSLDDDVRDHVPELPAYSRTITIRHLLHHTSGLRDYIGLLTLAGARTDDVTTAHDALDIIARQRQLNFEPGDEHLYSNSGYFLLSLIAERASGQSLRDFAREQIFEPLGMTRTHYLGSYDDIVPDRALAYSPRGGGGLRTDISRWLQLGDGAVFTTVEDLLHWDRNFYHPQVGGESLLTELQTPGRLESGSALRYALGLMIGEYRGQRTVSHGGSWGGYRAELLRFPDQHFSVATLCNLGSIRPGQLATRVADIYLADVLAPAAATPAATPAVARTAAAAAEPAPPRAALLELEGTYHSEELQTSYRIVAHEGTLTLQRRGMPAQPLQPVASDEFAAGSMALRFTRGADGAVTGYLLDLERIRDLRFHRTGGLN